MRKANLVETAIRIFGSEGKLAKAVGLSQPAIHKAKKQAEKGKRVSAELADKIDKATDGKVPRHRLRPDLFEPPSVAA